MPNPEIARLEPSSSKEQIQAAISACIATEVKRGHPQAQAIAMCHSMASTQTGKDLSKNS
jgi:Holliday junction resolvasome RuvABC endonuclease subunit